MTTTQDKNSVDYLRVYKEIWKRKKLFLYTLPATFFVSCIYILSIPRTYSTDTEVVPEAETTATGSGTLGSLASTFGLDLSAMESSDAITPLLYPDLMQDNGFVAKLFTIQVKTQDGLINTDYYNYLKKYQKSPWWDKGKSNLSAIFASKKRIETASVDPYQLSQKDADIVKDIQSLITIKVDKKTGAVSISASAQDPLVCKTLADSTRQHLQNFITAYRTNKAKKDMLYYKNLMTQAKAAYEKQRQLYASYSDANADIILVSYKSKIEDIENEMQLRYNTYSTLSNQYQAAVAKVQERTPVFMLIKGAAVPVKPTSPKRMVFVLAMLFLAFVATAVYICRDIVLPHE